MKSLLSLLDEQELLFLALLLQTRRSRRSIADRRDELSCPGTTVDAQTGLSKLCNYLEKEIGYLGSANVAYIYRKFARRDAGAPFRSIVWATYKYLGVEPPKVLGSDREMLELLVERGTTEKFRQLPAEEQFEILRTSDARRLRGTRAQRAPGALAVKRQEVIS